MRYNPNIHHRRSIRLKGYDYAQAGLYFVTICCQDRACLFGEIQNGTLKLNDAGCMVEKWYWELENKYPDKKCHEMVVMPNHFHGIVENMDTGPDVTNERPTPPYGPDNKKYRSPLGNAIGWFKTMTTNAYIQGVKKHGWNPFNGKLWQRNYYEHIIRNENAYIQISEYIINNPEKWQGDKFYQA